MAAFLFGANMPIHLDFYDTVIIAVTLALAAYILFLACTNNRDGK